MSTSVLSSPTPDRCDVGLVGLAVMGQNLVLNMADHGYHVAVYNRTTATTEEFVNANPPGAATFGSLGGGVTGYATPQAFIASLKKPRVIIVLVKAGPAVDAVCDQLLSAGLEPGDIVVDGGNSLWTDTIAREKKYRGRLMFFGSGVSGGETGARFGPSLMPGGDLNAWARLKPIWESIAAKVDPKTGKPLEGASAGKPIIAPKAEPCTTYIGSDGAGHYVKMVHNGIEYADMQLICEAYYLLRTIGGMNPDKIADVFADWNTGDLDSYLIEITAEVLRQRDPTKPRKPLLDNVLDTAGQKGTGKWTSVNALDMGIPAPTMTEAVFARCISALKEDRLAASKVLKGPKPKAKGGRKKLVAAVRDALYCSKICSYAQGFALMSAAQKEYNWKLSFGEIAMIWRGGCIIRARLLQKIKEAYDANPKLPNLMLAPFFRNKLKAGQAHWRKVVMLSAEQGVPCPSFMSALAYYDSYRSAVLPANLLQLQRDFFGAHTYERTDAPRGSFFHLVWSSPKRTQSKI